MGDVPLLQLLRDTRLRVLPLDAVDGNIARLADHHRLPRIVTQRLEQRQAVVIAQRAQRLGRLVPAHCVLVVVLEHAAEVWYRLEVAALPEAICELVLEQGRGRVKGRGDGLNGRD